MEMNPFRPTRYEHDSKPLLWQSPRAKELEAEGSFYVCGSRGSGKTSLLKTLHWRERQFNEALKRQLAESRSPFLSVYFRLPDHISTALALVNWSKLVPEAPDTRALSFAYFAALIEGIASQLIFEALDAHRHIGVLKFSAEAAQSEIDAFLGKFPEIKRFLNGSPSTYSDLADALDRFHRTLNVSATRGGAAEALKLVPTHEPGALVFVAANIAQTMFERFGRAKKFQVKICVDDCEVLEREQQRFLNGLVRKAASPVSWIVSYIGRDYEATTGVYKEHNLSGADRKVVDLDTEHESSFIRLCEAVSSLRVYYSMPEQDRSRLPPSDLDRIFAVDDVLGNVEINELIEFAFRSSLSVEFEAFRQRALQLAETMQSLTAKDIRRRSRFAEMFPKQSAPPYYQAHLLSEHYGSNQNIDGALASMERPDLARLNAYLRRKQRAAFIAICSKYKTRNIPYAGRSVIFGLSDGCIRDYLEIMAEIFDKYTTTRSKTLRFIDRHGRAPLGIEIQRAGAAASAESKFVGIKENIERNPVELSRIVDCLGNLTALLHKDISTAERGAYFVDSSEIRSFKDVPPDKVEETISGIVSRGISEGLLKGEFSTAPEDESGALLRTTKFRLHRRFAPRYGFSYRGPYEPVQLPWERVAEVCFAPDTVDPLKWANEVFNSLSGIDMDQGVLGL